MSVLPTRQRQWRQNGRGAPSKVLELHEDAPLPVLKSGRVLIKIAYATTSPSSWNIKMGLFPAWLTRGAVPEMEATGWVEDPNGSSLEKGQAVWACVDAAENFSKGNGVLAEYVSFEAQFVIPIPPPLTAVTALGMFTNCITAEKAVLDVGNIKAGQSVFINGGTTAIGMAMIQVAKLAGARKVVVSCSEASFEIVKKLGADKALDYRSSPIEQQLLQFRDNPFDLIIDNIGNQAAYSASPSFLKSEGQYLLCGMEIKSSLTATLSAFAIFMANAMCRPRWLGGVPRRAVFCSTPPSRARFEAVLDWIKQGKIQNPIDSTYSSDRAGVMAAYERGMSGRAKGKLAINMRDVGEPALSTAV